MLQTAVLYNVLFILANLIDQHSFFVKTNFILHITLFHIMISFFSVPQIKSPYIFYQRKNTIYYKLKDHHEHN